MKLFFCQFAGFVLMAACGKMVTAAAPAIDFGTQIRPILADKCVKCHGPDDAARQADLRLDGDAGIHTAFAGGNFEKSEAWKRIISKDDDERMPPADSGKTISADELALLKQWMESGAKWKPHWAFVKAEGRTQKAERRSGRNEIDGFVAERLEQEGLTFSREAERTTLIRRLSFDFTGLPPTVAEVDAFLADDSPQAYEKLVDRLLASPHYGERMAMDWLDGARYADTNGYQNDFERTMWPWRDWVISAFNANMPFNQFAVEQIAGDLLPNATDSQKIATGFNRNNRTVTESGSIDEEWRVENVVDRTETTTGVFLGLTFGCARCHDHKYDPITQREFYQFYAFFNSVNEKGVYREEIGNRGPMIEVHSEENRRRQAEIAEQIAKTEKSLRETKDDPVAEIETWLGSIPNDDSSATIHASSPMVRLTGSESTGKAPTGSSGSTSSSPIGPPQLVDRFLGKALNFSGQELVELADSFQPQRNGAFAVTTWVKPRLKDAGDVGTIVSKMDDRADYRGFDVLVQGDRKIAVHLINRWPKNAMKVVSKRSLPDDTWSHVVVSYDGTAKAKGLSIIVNGEVWQRDLVNDKLRDSLATDEPLRVGRRSTEHYFRGELADFTIYDRVVSPSEAAQNIRRTLQDALQQKDRFSPEQREELNRFAALLPGTKRFELARSLEALKQQQVIVPTVMVMQDLPKPRETYLLKRGRYDMPDKSASLQPDVPAFLPPLPKDAPRNRLTLARWIVSPENPLTARVVANRLWQQMFGVGLVKTAENFGVQAEPPSHPELLDWLALELVRSGWDLKHLQKTIAMSATYRQSSGASAALYERDPENRLLARGPRKRLPAESIRDNALAISGLLAPQIGGKSVFPYQPNGLWDDLAGGSNQKINYVQSHGDDLYRRSLYTYRKRTVSHPTMSTFDAPSWEICALKRPSTNTPLQALALLNDVTYAEAARKLAERMVAEGGATLVDRIRYGFRLATARTPSEDEIKTLSAGYHRYLGEFKKDPFAAEKALKVGESPLRVEHDLTELAAYATVASVLLNLDETIVKE
jgi:hypothetical protein